MPSTIVVGPRKPNQLVTALLNAAIAALQEGDMAEAERLCHRAMAVEPRSAEPAHILGVVLARFGNSAGAIKWFRRSVEMEPRVAEYHVNLGNSLRGGPGGAAESVPHYRAALKLEPDSFTAHFNLSISLTELGHFTEAAEHCRAAMAKDPSASEPVYGLGVICRSLGLIPEALEHNARAEQLRNDEGVQANEAFAKLYSDQHSPTDVAAAHRKAGSYIERKVGRPVVKFTNDTNFARPLRVGLVSSDFRRHAVACFVLPLLRNYDPKTMEITCYAEVGRPDDWTAGMKELAGRWCYTPGFTDDQVAKRIRADSIDVLIDLNGYTAGNRLGVFARRSAPVQVTALGHPHSLGMKRGMDYRLVDDITDPPEADALATEQLVRMPGGFLCYDPPAQKLPVGPPPSRKRGYITFGSFSTLPKVSPSCLAAWAELLKRVPSSRLLLKAHALGDLGARERVRGDLAKLGIDPTRIKCVGFEKKWTDALERYADVDIALDPWPYCGTTTTCEALWMGVPLVTLCGASHHSRVGASILSRLGLPELVADDVAGYLDRAQALAADPTSLAMLRASLRDTMRAATLCDGPGFAVRFEDTIRGLYANWCHAQGVTAPEASATVAPGS